ncbi:cytochrome P450 [Bombardia bombarda]|uniref:Cytochrome P450 n=1 Tax=Bombardia bombarda TaxID=252184 RepID=A0AA39XCM9_9PEZI|nr:cytochrome P450 [Bombardia bombarda]
MEVSLEPTKMWPGVLAGLVGAGLTYVVATVTYRRFLHPLANVPGPFLPAVTWLYIWWFNIPKAGQFYKEIERLHSIYGPIDPAFYGFFGLGMAMFATESNELYRQRRAPLNSFFSRKTVLELEDVVHEKTDSERDQPTGMHHGFRALSLDVITDYAFNDCYNFLDTPDFGLWFAELTKVIGPRVVANILEIKRKIDAGIKPKKRTVFHQLLDPELAESRKFVSPSVTQMENEAFSIIGAASDTVGQTLTVGTAHIITNPTICKRLRQELVAAYPDPTAKMLFTDLEKLPYLTAVIKESLRLSYAILARLPRKIGAKGLEVQGYFIPNGMSVSMSAWMMNRNPEAFPGPDRFDPTRWLDPDPNVVRAREKCLVAFSRGSRVCLGLILAWCELYVTFGTVFRQFENLEAYNSGPEDLFLRGWVCAWFRVKDYGAKLYFFFDGFDSRPLYMGNVTANWGNIKHQIACVVVRGGRDHIRVDYEDVEGGGPERAVPAGWGITGGNLNSIHVPIRPQPQLTNTQESSAMGASGPAGSQDGFTYVAADTPRTAPLYQDASNGLWQLRINRGLNQLETNQPEMDAEAGPATAAGTSTTNLIPRQNQRTYGRDPTLSFGGSADTGKRAAAKEMRALENMSRPSSWQKLMKLCVKEGEFTAGAADEARTLERSKKLEDDSVCCKSADSVFADMLVA